MRLVFFDLEFSNSFSGIGKICEFGYVTTDEHFNVLEENVFIINPGEGREYRFFIEQKDRIDSSFWYYPIEYYFKQPEFPYFYERIKNLLEGNDVVAFAYSYLNDILQLESTVKRYGLKSIDYKCYDVQKFTRLLNLENKNPGLSNVVSKILDKDSYSERRLHLSKDDAYLEMLVFKAIFESANVDLLTFLNAHKDYSLQTSEYFIKKEKLLKEREEKEAVSRYYKSAIDNEQKNIKNLKNTAKPAYFTRELRFSKENIDDLITFSRKNNYYLVDNPLNAEVIVYQDDSRLKRLLNHLEKKNFLLIKYSNEHGEDLNNGTRE